MTIVTIGSIRDYDTGDTTIESFATRLFNEWGVGNIDTQDGVMLLVAVNDRDVRIEVGTGYESTLNNAMKGVIDEHIVPAFRRNDYQSGIYQGARGAIQVLTGDFPADVSSTASPQPNSGGVNPVMLGGAGVLILGGALFAIRSMQMRTRQCSECKSRMKRLTGSTAEEHLSDGQKLEQIMRNAQYSVWACPNGHRPLIERPRQISNAERCAQCDFKTVQYMGQRTLLEPTTVSAGEREHYSVCKNCGNEINHIESVPRLPTAAELEAIRIAEEQNRQSSYSSSSSDSSSSSSSDFGGGSSSGDGASGSW